MDDPARELLDAWVQHGDERAFASLVKQQRPMVDGVCRRVLGDGLAADEAAQDALVALSHDAGAIRGHPGAWLRTTALHAALRRKRHLQAVLPVEGVEATADDPGDDEERLRQLALVDECVERLSAGERDLVVALFYHQISQRELARTRGVSQARIAQRLARALDRLREDLRRRGLGMRRSALVGLLACFGAGEALSAGMGVGWVATAGGPALAVAAALALATWFWLQDGSEAEATSPSHPPAPAPMADAAPQVQPGRSASAAPAAAAIDSAADPASGHALVPLPAGDALAWLAGGKGWNEHEWEVWTYHTALPILPMSEIQEFREPVRPNAILGWREAVGNLARPIIIDGKPVLAFPMTKLDASTYCSLHCREGRGLRTPQSPTRRRTTLIKSVGADWQWIICQIDWMPAKEDGWWRIYRRISILASTVPGIEVGSLCGTHMFQQREPMLAGDFVLEPGMLMAEPAVRLLTPAECDELKAACKQSAAQEQ